MHNISNEFIYFDPEFEGEYGDFTDNRVFSPLQREEYLEKYASFLKKSYSVSDCPELAVPLSSVKDTLASFNLVKNEFHSMRAYTKKLGQRYKGWTLFTAKAIARDGKIVLKSAELPPNPAAEYLFDKDFNLEEIKFDFIMDKEYEAVNHGIIRDTTTTRSVELRCGFNEIVKICFYHNGECYLRRMENDPYHLKFTKLGTFKFGEKNSVKIRLNDNGYDVVLNDCELTNQPYLTNEKPESLFLSSGMFHFGDWQIEPLSVKYQGKTVTNFFVEENETETMCQNLGIVSLPYAIGCVENRNNMLILEKEFVLPDTPFAELHFETLDPGGEVYIDGEKVFSTDGFDSFSVDVSNLNKNQKHLLRVEVFPRAPEVFFAWHRHKDPYNGWFCGEISLKGYGECRISDLKVVTENVSGRNIRATFSGYVNKSTAVSVYIEKIHNGSSKALKVAEISADGEFSVSAKFEADAWGINNPNLYKVSFQAFDGCDVIAEEFIETGFRTIEQIDGEIHLNGSRIDLKGALLMQFLPPYHKTPESHICPTDEEILWQEMMLREMGGNTLRLHILGYGTNDARYARFADRLGIMLIWITRYIDSIEAVQWQGKWRAKEKYTRQIKERINHPSIIMWEGSNEFRPNIRQINDAFNAFVPAVKNIDSSRLICPVSHLYYAADLYPTRGCEYLSEDGIHDHNGNETEVSPYWDDELVVRSAHTYSLLCGYGAGWDSLRLQNWGEQEKLLSSKKHAYMVSEYAVIGRQNPDVPEAKSDYFNPFSY